MLEDYARDGYAFPIPVLDAEEVRRFAAAVAALGREVRRDCLHERFDWARELVSHPRVVAAAAEALGGAVETWGTVMFSKQPHNDAFVAWHQDGWYAHLLRGAPAVSAWIALTDSTRENGCMRVIPRSQARLLPHVERHTPGNILVQGQELVDPVDERDAVDVELHAGEMSLHDINLIHGSRGNPTDWPRVGFVVRYRLRSG